MQVIAYYSFTIMIKIELLPIYSNDERKKACLTKNSWYGVSPRPLG